MRVRSGWWGGGGGVVERDNYQGSNKFIGELNSRSSSDRKLLLSGH